MNYLKTTRAAAMAAVAFGTMLLAACGGGGSQPCNTVVDGTGAPSIVFTSVPTLGSSDLLHGQVTHVASSGYSVVVFIKVNGGWWVKPYDDAPLTTISCDGSWSTDIVTGGEDQNATQINAYLVPANFPPPLLGGEAAIPTSMSAYPSATVTRTN